MGTSSADMVVGHGNRSPSLEEGDLPFSYWRMSGTSKPPRRRTDDGKVGDENNGVKLDSVVIRLDRAFDPAYNAHYLGLRRSIEAPTVDHRPKKEFLPWQSPSLNPLPTDPTTAPAKSTSALALSSLREPTLAKLPPWKPGNWPRLRAPSWASTGPAWAWPAALTASTRKEKKSRIGGSRPTPSTDATTPSMAGSEPQ